MVSHIAFRKMKNILSDNERRVNVGNQMKGSLRIKKVLLAVHGKVQISILMLGLTEEARMNVEEMRILRSIAGGTLMD